MKQGIRERPREKRTGQEQIKRMLEETDRKELPSFSSAEQAILDTKFGREEQQPMAESRVCEIQSQKLSAGKIYYAKQALYILQGIV